MSTIGGTFRDTSRQQDLSLYFASGFLSLVSSTYIALQRTGNFDLLIVIIFGSLLCLKMHTRGLCYALALLFIGSLTKHLLLLHCHLWQLGIESSIALGLFISTMASKLLEQQNTGLRTQAENKEQTIRNLEDELLLSRKEAQEEQITLRDRLAALQTEFEETSGDLSTLHILNDVLRKTSAKQSHDLEETQRQLAALKEELEEQKNQNENLEEIRRLYLQLRNQFDQKNDLLNQTRRELFASETRLERSSLEKEEQKYSNPFSSLEQELISLSNENSCLEKENQELVELVTLLSQPPKRKKKEKKPEEELLF